MKNMMWLYTHRRHLSSSFRWFYLREQHVCRQSTLKRTNLKTNQSRTNGSPPVSWIVAVRVGIDRCLIEFDTYIFIDGLLWWWLMTAISVDFEYVTSLLSGESRIVGRARSVERNRWRHRLCTRLVSRHAHAQRSKSMNDDRLATRASPNECVQWRETLVSLPRPRPLFACHIRLTSRYPTLQGPSIFITDRFGSLVARVRSVTVLGSSASTRMIDAHSGKLNSILENNWSNRRRTGLFVEMRHIEVISRHLIVFLMGLCYATNSDDDDEKTRRLVRRLSLSLSLSLFVCISAPVVFRRLFGQQNRKRVNEKRDLLVD
jgi:hypothetical protein